MYYFKNIEKGEYTPIEEGVDMSKYQIKSIYDFINYDLILNLTSGYEDALYNSLAIIYNMPLLDNILIEV